MTYPRGFYAIRRPPIMLNITPHTDDSGDDMKQYSTIEVGDVLKDKGDVVTLENTGTLYEARNLIMRYSISRLVIVQDNRRKYPVGIITEKDIVRLLYKGTHGRRLDEITVDEAMSKNLVTDDKNESLIACAKKMIDRKFSSILIVEATVGNEWAIVGIITKTDIIRRYPSLSRKKHKVSDFMATNVYTVVPSALLHEAMLFMVNGNISRVVVIEKRKPVGIITMHDLLPVGTLVNPFFNRFEKDEFTLASPPATSVPFPSGVRAKLVASDIMKTDLSTITKDRDLNEAATVMVERRISGLPVVEQKNADAANDEEILIGLITKTDITRALISDNAISTSKI
jgi:CBS domain-containing protein